MTKIAPSRKAAAARESPLPAARLRAIDAAAVALLLTIALFMAARSGFRRGMELMPWPDGLEYAAAAVNLDHGLGPVLHFGGYSYPSRYTEGYPMLLAAAFPLLRHRVELLCLATLVLGLVAISALYALTLLMFGRLSALVAGALLTLSPLFITYSTLVLSDVPTLTVTILAALALFYASEAEDAASSASAWIVATGLCGLFAGFTIIIRPTNATIVVGIAVALYAVRPRRRISEMLPPAIALAIGLAIFPAWQAIENWRRLGGPFNSGYVFWVPEVYGTLGKTFGAQFLFGPTMPRNPHGNVLSYLVTIAGLDGMLGDPGDPRYVLYPFAAAVFAVIGIRAALRDSAGRPAARVVWFGLGFLVSLLVLYLFYFFTEMAFILPALFIVFAAAGYGVIVGNRALRDARANRRRTSRDLAVIAFVAVLDLMLAFSIATEAGSRAAATPRPSAMVPALVTIRAQLEPDAIVVSNISLQFLELYFAKPGTRLLGLNSFDPGEQFTDYHLARLYAKRGEGWKGRVPPVVFAGQRIDDAELKSLEDSARAGKPLYLLVAAPEHRAYADLLKDELTRLGDSFALEPIAQSDLLEFDRLKLR